MVFFRYQNSVVSLCYFKAVSYLKSADSNEVVI